MELRADDAFWAARRVMAFTDDLIRAAVHTGQFSDPAAERHLAAVLIKRRDAIGRAYLTAINPIVDPRLDAAGVLTFENAAVTAGVAEAPAAYRAVVVPLRQRDRRDTSRSRETQSATASMTPPAGLSPTAAGSFIAVDITADERRPTRRGSSRCARTSAARVTAGSSSAWIACLTGRLLQTAPSYDGLERAAP